MNTNFFKVKFIYNYNNKKYIFSVDNVEAYSSHEANLKAGELIKQNIKAEIITILKRKKGQKCKDI